MIDLAEVATLFFEAKWRVPTVVRLDRLSDAEREPEEPSELPESAESGPIPEDIQRQVDEMDWAR